MFTNSEIKKRYRLRHPARNKLSQKKYNYKNNNKCLECGCLIMNQSTFCKPCSKKGKRNPLYLINREIMTNNPRKIRDSVPYNDWRTSIYKRDNYTCQLCAKRGGNLNAHHIYSFSEYPKLALEEDNGVTLCEECHRLLEGLNKRMKWKESAIECLEKTGFYDNYTKLTSNSL